MNVEVILTPAEIATLPARDLSETVCVVFDVLRATSTMLTAFANGASRIFPVSTIEEARKLQREQWPDALLGGERNGVRIDGFQLGNSPLEYTRAVVEGRDIITTTTNGTVSLRACQGANAVVLGALVNLDAIVSYLTDHRGTESQLLLVCAGTGERFALEDGFAAGALVDGLLHAGSALTLQGAATAILALYRSSVHNPLAVLRSSENGQRLIELGLEADVAYCTRPSVLDWIATMCDGALQGVQIPAIAKLPQNEAAVATFIH